MPIIGGVRIGGLGECFHELLMEEIRRSPVEVGRLSHYLQGFKISQLVNAGFLNHQQVSFT